ncbi:hypothetical protein K450DRAFT_223546 [Umbelopsis ramanniana AG]|uniref:Exonuclease domain-containing protein n=1 Tax=Umbelopsis ramanniana AG TaxID=1314678 RepID=A0AAD5HIL5_UMBRA|nr:uncharacterized protein K450DRAFT_223546 [Umbelopsis ramanniana AG]KAI8583413.1 hypothetical protein K450DRAFT_223546 [Umbelopsis ramanniana AG]
MEPALREEPLKNTKDVVDGDADVDTLTSRVDKLRLDLAELGCSIKGNKQTLQRRLKQAKKNGISLVINEPPVQKDSSEKEKLSSKLVNENFGSQKSLPNQPFDYYLFFDVEATCERDTKNYPHEIIEFPVLLVDGESFDIVDQYRSYVKPSINPTLSEFCTSLTGISQQTVDNSPDFIDVLNEFQVWMAKYSLFQDKTAIFVTDGPFDINNFIAKQCNHDNISIPMYFHQWVDIRRIYARFYNCRQENITGMLAALHMDFEGRAHSGLDDARNVYNIAKRMRDKGCRFKKTTKYRAAAR